MQFKGMLIEFLTGYINTNTKKGKLRKFCRHHNFYILFLIASAT